MIRLATKDDQDVVIAIAKNVGLFEPEELVFLEEMFNKWLEGDLGENSKWIVASKGGVVIGTAYFAPEQFAYGTWNVYFIAVEPDKQRSGIGADLMDYIEKVLATQGERVLIVETLAFHALKKQENSTCDKAITKSLASLNFIKLVMIKSLLVSRLHNFFRRTLQMSSPFIYRDNTIIKLKHYIRHCKPNSFAFRHYERSEAI